MLNTDPSKTSEKNAHIKHIGLENLPNAPIKGKIYIV